MISVVAYPETATVACPHLVSPKADLGNLPLHPKRFNEQVAEYQLHQHDCFPCNS
jgi:hypothetical protein